MQKIYPLIGKLTYHISLPARVLLMSQKPRVYVLLCHRDQILLVKNWFGSGIWSLPGGGLKRSENNETAAIREISEEVGIKLSSQDLKFLTNGNHRRQKGLKQYALFYVALKSKPEVIINGVEITEAKWISIDDLKKDNQQFALSFEVTEALAKVKLD